MAAEEFGIPEKDAVAAAAILIAGLSGLLERWIVARDSRRLLEETFIQLTIGGLRQMAAQHHGA